MRTHSMAMLSIGWIGSILPGCGTGEILDRPPRPERITPSSSIFMLNEWADDTDDLTTTGQSIGQTSTQPASMNQSTTTTRPAATTQPVTTTQSAVRVAYSAPSGAHRQLVLTGSALHAASLGQFKGAGREAGEAQMTGGLTPLSAVTGAPGLGAPQPLTSNVIVGQDGLQPGIAIGFGPLPPNNLFTRNIYPISGPGGACAALRRAGFPVNGRCQNP